MDLGLGGLIDKIEARFGKFVTNALLAALILVVFAWAAETILSFYIEGKNAWDSGEGGAALGLIKFVLANAAVVVLSLLVYSCGFRILKYRTLWEYRKVKQYGKKARKEVEDDLNQILRDVEELEERRRVALGERDDKV